MKDLFLNQIDLIEDLIITKKSDKKFFIYPEILFQCSSKFKKFKLNDEIKEVLQIIFKKHFGCQAYIIPEFIKLKILKTDFKKEKHKEISLCNNFVIEIKEFVKNKRTRIYVPVFSVKNYSFHESEYSLE